MYTIGPENNKKSGADPHFRRLQSYLHQGKASRVRERSTV